MTRDSFWQRLWRGVKRFRGRPDWEQALGEGWQERVMDTPVTDHFHAKQGRSTGRLILDGEERQLAVYLKRHYKLPRVLGFLATFWPGKGWSPALDEYHHLEWARALGIPVPESVAAGEIIGPWGRLQSFLAVEELHDMLPLHQAIPLAFRRLDPHTFARWKRSLMAEMARLTRVLHDHRLFHKDLYLCHFYIAREDTGRLPGWHGRVHLIDLHRLAHHPWIWRVWQSKDLAQLLYSSEVEGVTARDRLRFWKLYMGKARKSRLVRWLRRLVVLRWGRYRRHNARHARPTEQARAS